MHVAIIGAGLMGAQIGCEYALGGHEVRLHARDPRRAEERVGAGLGLLEAHGLRTAEEVRAAALRVSAAAHPGEAARGADLIVESLPEDLELKGAVLRTALEQAEHPIVATNTSSLPISALGEEIGAPERTVGTHYLNPPLLMPTVEVIAGERTAPGTVTFVRDMLVSLGKVPIVVRRDVPGFVWNRLQFALVRECAWLVEHGVATREDVDTVIREGLARRWRHVGPLRAVALGGIDTWNRSALSIVPDLSNARALPDLSTVAITEGKLDEVAGARDAALARELRDERSTGPR